MDLPTHMYDLSFIIALAFIGGGYFGVGLAMLVNSFNTFQARPKIKGEKE